MPRHPWMYIPGFPYHIFQRGNNRKACFLFKEDRHRSYRELFRGQIDAEDLHLIRKAEYYCQPVSSERFREELSVHCGFELGQMFRGRPKKHEELWKK